jgi:hypothetical protein
MSTELTAPESKESKLAKILKGLNERELGAYRYFIRAKQPSIAEDKAEEMFRLYARGSSCEEIRRLFPVFGLGAIVACRVAFEWDSRVTSDRENQKKDVVERTTGTQLEMQEFLSTLMAVSNQRFMDAMKLYIATRDPKYLEGIPLPKNIRDVQGMIDAYMKIAGLDSKKVDVSVHGNVNHSASPKTIALQQDEAEAAVDQLLGDVVDVEVTPVLPQSQVPVAASTPQVTPEQVIHSFMREGASYEQAVAMLEDLQADIHRLAAKYAEVATEAGKPDKDTEVN